MHTGIYMIHVTLWWTPELTYSIDKISAAGFLKSVTFSILPAAISRWLVIIILFHILIKKAARMWTANFICIGRSVFNIIITSGLLHKYLFTENPTTRFWIMCIHSDNSKCMHSQIVLYDSYIMLSKCKKHIINKHIIKYILEYMCILTTCTCIMKTVFEPCVITIHKTSYSETCFAPNSTVKIIYRLPRNWHNVHDDWKYIDLLYFLSAVISHHW